uniref:KIAA1755 n=1 Tax=Anas zonorhyncha TaxID=75864 RepID=A0A8B9VQ13_9AVES
MDAQSLDAAVQGALRALYPPFEATAPTVLGQVFRLLETSYRGDGLCCLLEFLIPAKRLFEHVRQAACAPYFNCIFLHEGWPLCLHEKVVVHLAPLNPLLLRSGDFYLQAEPCEEHSARITVKHLSHDLRSVEETPIPEATYALLFTNEWLEEINCDHAGPPLHTCLVATENGIAPLPWSKIATPEFIDKPKAGPDTVPTGAPGGLAPEPAAAIIPAPRSTPSTPEPYSNITGTIPGCKDASWKSKQGRYPGLIKVDQAASRQTPAVLDVPSLQEIISQNLEGEYVDLLDLSQEKLDLLARSLPPTHPLGQGAAAVLPWASGGPGVGSWPRVGGPSSQEGPCSPCQKRRLSGEPGLHGPRCRHRDSYLAALQNPVSFGPGLMAAILEEPDSPVPPAASCKTPTPRGSRAGHPSSPPLLAHRPHRARPGVTGGEAAGPGSPRLPPATARSEAAGSGHKFSFLKGPRLGTAPGDGSASQHEGGWKKVSAIYSPRMGRAKAAGKGMDAAAAAPTEDRSLQSTSVQNGPAAPRSRQPPGWQELHAGLLRSGIICLPGGTDKLGRALLQVTTSGSAWGASWCSATELAKLLLCLCSLPRKDTKDSGLTAVVDARRQPPSPALFSALRSVQSVSPGCIHGVLLLADKELGTHRERLPGVQVETLTSLKALGRYVDSSQVTAELDGTFPYCHGEWVQFFQVSVITPSAVSSPSRGAPLSPRL